MDEKTIQLLIQKSIATGTNNKVEKVLTEEQQTLLQNIVALVNQIQQMEGGMPEEEMEIEMARHKDEEDEKKKMEKRKEDEEKEDEEEKRRLAKQEGTDARDDAEERTADDNTESTEENIDEVSKNLKMLIKNGLISVNKDIASNPAKLSNVLIATVKNLADTVKKMKADQNSTTKAMENIIEGLGIADQIKESAKVKEEKRQPVVVKDNAREILDFIAKAGEEHNKTAAITNDSNSQTARKSLAGILPNILKQGATK